MATTAPAVQSQALNHRNYSFDILRIVSICGVVAIHIFGLRVGKAPKSGDGWWLAVIADISFIWVVPVFVMISGALLLSSKLVTANPQSFYRKRLLRLLPALVVWNLVYLVGVRIYLRDETLSTARILQLIFDGSVFTQLYFLWLILGLYAIAPVLAAFMQAGNAKRSIYFGLAVLAITVLAFAVPGYLSGLKVSRPISLNMFTHWVPYVGYFVLGFALRNVRLRGWKLAAVSLATFATISFTVWHFGHRGVLGVVDRIVGISYLGAGVALSALGIFVIGLSLFSGWNPRPIVSKTVVALSDATFGVFLVHLAIFEVIRLNVPAVKTGLSVQALLVAYVVTLALSFLVSLIALRIPVIKRVF